MFKNYAVCLILSVLAVGFTGTAQADAAKDASKATKLTAAAVNGQWSGTLQSLQPFSSPYFSSSVGPNTNTPSDTVNITIPDGPYCIGGPPCAINTTTEAFQLNLPSNKTLVSVEQLNGIVFNLTASGSSVKGSVSSDQGVSGTIYGTIVGQQFMLLHIMVNGPNPGACQAGQYQITASMVPIGSDKVLVFSGSGVGDQCEHEIISGKFQKQL